MPTEYRRVLTYLERLRQHFGPIESFARSPSADLPSAPHVTTGHGLTPEEVDERWRTLPVGPDVRDALLDALTRERLAAYRSHIENFIGTVKVPVGVAGPLRVQGLFARGDYYVPLATTEAALVASYNRGARVVTESGGCRAAVINEGVSRAPGFAFRDLREAGLFAAWAATQLDAFREAADATTRHGRLLDMRIALEGNHVYLIFEYVTGDASGQNMVTIATEAICQHIVARTPVAPEYWFVEANLSGDKKASLQSFLGVRGKKVSAETVVPGQHVRDRLHTTPERMADYWRMSAIGGVLSGTIGVHGHYANGLAAVFIACGQDPASVAESAVGITRFEVQADGALYASVTLPNLIVGTVGGGTGLPSQRACLEVLGLAGPGTAQAFAEVCAAVVLAGELSIVGALAAGHFTQAHVQLARGRTS